MSQTTFHCPDCNPHANSGPSPKDCRIARIWSTSSTALTEGKGDDKMIGSRRPSESAHALS
jgi:hypothetical protein